MSFFLNHSSLLPGLCFPFFSHYHITQIVFLDLCLSNKILIRTYNLKNYFIHVILNLLVLIKFYPSYGSHFPVSFSCVCAQSLHSYPTLWNPMDYSLTGSSVHEIVQARILEWVSIPSPKESSWPRSESMSPVPPGLQVNSLPTELPGKLLPFLNVSGNFDTGQ